jgi:hypothetical protein
LLDGSVRPPTAGHRRHTGPAVFCAAPAFFHASFAPPMENTVDRTIRLLAIGAGVVSLLMYVVFHFI